MSDRADTESFLSEFRGLELADLEGADDDTAAHLLDWIEKAQGIIQSQASDLQALRERVEEIAQMHPPRFYTDDRRDGFYEGRDDALEILRARDGA